ncbi:hypothetical protein [Bacillus sp. JCM 19041]
MKTIVNRFLWVHTDKPNENKQDVQPLEAIAARLRKRGVDATVCQRQN